LPDLVTIVVGVRDRVISDLVPGGVLRAAINLGNPVLAQGPAAAPAGTVRFLAAAIEELKASGFIGDALRRSGQGGVIVAPPEPSA
jgi:hypothetical protein